MNQTPRGQTQTALVSIGAAVLLVALKLGTGIATGSLALVSAGIESSGDVVAAIFTLAAIRLGGRPADREHPYGHRRAENLAALGEAAILSGGGVFVVIEAIRRLNGGSESFDPRWYVFAVIAIALAVDISRVAVSLRGAAEYRSAALRSNALHFAGDMAGSFAVLLGISAVALGFHEGDAIASLLVAAIIFTAAARLIYENALILMDTTPAEAQVEAEAAIAALGDDLELRQLRLRESGGRYFADAIVTVPEGQAVAEGHQAADAVERTIHEVLPGSDVVVHVEPRHDGLDLRERVQEVALEEPLVKEVHDARLLRTDGGSVLFVTLALDRASSPVEARELAGRLEARLRGRLADVIDVVVHTGSRDPA